MKKIFSTATILVILFLTFPCYPQVALDNMIIKFPENEKWIQGNKVDRNGIAILELVPEGQTVHNWADLITIIEHYNLHISLEAFFADALDKLKKRCPYTIDYGIKEKNNNNLIYTVKISNEDKLIEFSAVRLLSGKEGIWSIQYSTKESPLLPNKIKTMFNFIKDAELKTPQEL